MTIENDDKDEQEALDALENQLMVEDEEEKSEADSETYKIHKDMVDIKFLILGLAKKMKGFERDLYSIRKQQSSLIHHTTGKVALTSFNNSRPFILQNQKTMQTEKHN